MTRDQLEAEARRQVEALGPEGTELVGLRALRRKVWCWTYLTRAELEAVLGACVVVRLIHEEWP